MALPTDERLAALAEKLEHGIQELYASGKYISDTQMGYITGVEAGHGLLRMGGSLVPFFNIIPRDNALYKLMTTTPGEA